MAGITLRPCAGLPVVGGVLVYRFNYRVVRVLALSPLPAPVWQGGYLCQWQATHAAIVQTLGVVHHGVLFPPRRACKPRRVLVREHVAGKPAWGYVPCTGL